MSVLRSCFLNVYNMRNCVYVSNTEAIIDNSKFFNLIFLVPFYYDRISQLWARLRNSPHYFSSFLFRKYGFILSLALTVSPSEITLVLSASIICITVLLLFHFYLKVTYFL